MVPTAPAKDVLANRNPELLFRLSHAENADTRRLRHAIFKGGRFDPARSLKATTAHTGLAEAGYSLVAEKVERR